MPRRPVPVSRGAGGYVFAPDPRVAVSAEPAIWLPELAPNALLLRTAPQGFQIDVSLDPASVASKLAYREGDGLLVTDDAGELQIELLGAAATTRPAILVPADAMYELRLDIALRFLRRLHGKRVNLLPRALRLTALQRVRLIHLLHAFDVYAAGGGPRDVAAEVLGSGQAQLPSVEWKDSHTRRKANRLIHDSLELVERGYLKLLRGG